jgi:hypothetical protein
MNTTAIQSFMPYNVTFPSTYTASVEDPTNSPQYASNFTLDAVEIGVKSLLIGRMTANQAANSLQINQLRQKDTSSLGLATSTMFKTAGKAGLIGGAVSAGRNIYHLANGEINMARAGGNVGADILGGTIGGMVSSAGASLAVKSMANASFGMGTVGLIGGAIGFAVADSLYHVSGLRDTVSNKVTSIIERWLDVDAQGGGV